MYLILFGTLEVVNSYTCIINLYLWEYLVYFIILNDDFVSFVSLVGRIGFMFKGKFGIKLILAWYVIF